MERIAIENGTTLEMISIQIKGCTDRSIGQYYENVKNAIKEISDKFSFMCKNEDIKGMIVKAADHGIRV